ncbi:hypothetical protein BN946_scf185014.g138 [Trametes cinnabarina]|uniref:Uncharacterized protein n=1 Tax=Pycnoporus cinnabarinus TaxID=5643 RepID=A0A060SMM1_PYCCI|nr:hypothetical protein BN946_scf185014.g138 [Trametes cinnabarina]
MSKATSDLASPSISPIHFETSSIPLESNERDMMQDPAHGSGRHDREAARRSLARGPSALCTMAWLAKALIPAQPETLGDHGCRAVPTVKNIKLLAAKAQGLLLDDREGFKTADCGVPSLVYASVALPSTILLRGLVCTL